MTDLEQTIRNILQEESKPFLFGLYENSEDDRWNFIIKVRTRIDRHHLHLFRYSDLIKLLKDHPIIEYTETFNTPISVERLDNIYMVLINRK